MNLMHLKYVVEVDKTKSFSKAAENLYMGQPNLSRAIKELEQAIQNHGSQPVILCSSPIRLPFRRLLERTYPQISIMSYNEISPNIKTKSVGVVRVTKGNL